MTKSKLRGHNIEVKNGIWVYSDTLQPVTDTRACNHCSKKPLLNDIDNCVGNLPGISNACCGHGVISESYITLLDGTYIKGVDAKLLIDLLKKYRKDDKQ